MTCFENKFCYITIDSSHSLINYHVRLTKNTFYPHPSPHARSSSPSLLIPDTHGMSLVLVTSVRDHASSSHPPWEIAFSSRIQHICSHSDVTTPPSINCHLKPRLTSYRFSVFPRFFTRLLFVALSSPARTLMINY